jgi:threonine synthase
MSCSIDILISSNLERLLFEVADRDPELVKAWMRSLAETGAYDIGKKRLDALSSFFFADCCDEDDTLCAIRRVFDETGYLMDPHTAVAQTIYERYREELSDGTQTVLLSTASPFKFATDVLGAFEQPGADDFANAERLGRATGRPVPQGIRGLRGKRELHTDVCELADMRRRVLDGVRKG